MKTWISPKAQKGLPSKIQGVGLFALKNIAKDEIIAIKAGSILTLEQVKELNFINHPELQIAVHCEAVNLAAEKFPAAAEKRSARGTPRSSSTTIFLFCFAAAIL